MERERESGHFVKKGTYSTFFYRVLHGIDRENMPIYLIGNHYDYHF